MEWAVVVVVKQFVAVVVVAVMVVDVVKVVVVVEIAVWKIEFDCCMEG